MNLVQKAGLFSSKFGIVARGLRVLSNHDKLVAEFKNIIDENAEIDLTSGDFSFHGPLPSEIENKHLKVDYAEYYFNHYRVLIDMLKKYKKIVEGLTSKTAKKFTDKIDKRIEKAKIKNNEKDVKLYEEEKASVGTMIEDIVKDYEYFYNLFNLINVKLLGQKNNDLSIG